LIPYIDMQWIELGPLRLKTFPVLVASGVLFGVWLADRRVRGYGLDPAILARASLVLLLFAFPLSHITSIVLYFPRELLNDPRVLFDMSKGLSSFGGFLGALLGAIFVYRRAGVSFWAYSDCQAFAFAFAWIFGRLGCSVVHDHPGIPSDFVLAVLYPATEQFPAGPRHDLGLYELLWTLGLASAFFFLRKRPHFPGFYLLAWMLFYPPVRFGLDFLRSADVRYGGLTPGQYGCIAMFSCGLFFARRLAQSERVLDPRAGSR
jgi:phosphatidylglycerol:prolipoprotein diacylglycerol transferase